MRRRFRYITNVQFAVRFGTCTIPCRFWYMYQGLFLHTHVHALYQVLPDWMTHAALMSDINEGVRELGIFWISFCGLHMHHKGIMLRFVMGPF